MDIPLLIISPVCAVMLLHMNFSAAGNRSVNLLRMCPHLLLLMKSWPHVVSPLQSFLSPPFVLRHTCEGNTKSSGEKT